MRMLNTAEQAKKLSESMLPPVDSIKVNKIRIAIAKQCSDLNVKEDYTSVNFLFTWTVEYIKYELVDGVFIWRFNDIF